MKNKGIKELILGIFCMLFLWGCDQLIDFSPPTVKIISPKEGETVVKLSLQIEVEASDDRELSKIEIYVGHPAMGDHLIKTSEISPCTCSWTYNPITFEEEMKKIIAKVYDKGGNWSKDEVNVQISTTPKLVFTRYEVAYDSDGNDTVNAGDTVGLDLYFRNDGLAKVYYFGTVTLSTNDNYVTIIDTTRQLAEINPGAEGKPIYAPKFSVAESCSVSHIISFHVDVEAEWNGSPNYSYSADFNVEVH